MVYTNTPSTISRKQITGKPEFGGGREVAKAGAGPAKRPGGYSSSPFSASTCWYQAALCLGMRSPVSKSTRTIPKRGV